METVLNKAERKFVRMSWEVAKAKRSNESINSTSHSHSLPPFFFEKCQSPSHIHRHKTLWKSWGKHKRAKRGRKCSGSLYIESSAGSTWFREMKRGFLALPCCSFSTFSLGFAYYIRKKKRIDTRHKHRETGRWEPGRFGLVERVFLPFSNGFGLVLYNYYCNGRGAGVRNGTEIAP